MVNPNFRNNFLIGGRLHTSLTVTVFSLFAISAMSCSAASGQKIPSFREEAPIDLNIVARFPAEWLLRIEFALDEFRKTDQNLECFTVSIGRDEAVQLDFVAISPTVNLTASGGFGRVDGCGIGIAYYFDEERKFVRSEIQK